MKNNILRYLAAVFLGCGLFTLIGCTSGREQQLEAAIEAINKDYPMVIDDAVTMQSVTLEDSVVAFGILLKEEMMSKSLTQEEMEQWREPFVSLFGTMVHENSSIDQLFRLIDATDHTMSVRLTTTPSYKTYSLSLSKGDITRILEVNRLPQ